MDAGFWAKWAGAVEIFVFEIDHHAVRNTFADSYFGKNYFFKKGKFVEKTRMGKQVCPGKDFRFCCRFFHKEFSGKGAKAAVIANSFFQTQFPQRFGFLEMRNKDEVLKQSKNLAQLFESKRLAVPSPRRCDHHFPRLFPRQRRTKSILPNQF